MARTTLKKFIKNFNVKPFSRWIGEEVPNLKQLSSVQKYDLINNFYLKEVLSVKEDHIYYVIDCITIKRSGRNYFVNRLNLQSIYIDSKNVVIKKTPKRPNTVDAVFRFLDICNLNYFYDIKPFGRWIVQNKSSFLKSILVRTIYNQETLYNAIGKRIYHVNIGWRNIRKWLEMGNSMSLTDLKEYTKNINDSIKVFLSSDISKQLNLQDLLKCAIQLNEIVDFTWSDNRLHEEHNRQIEQLTQLEIEKKEDVTIFEEFNLPDNIKLLNTEREIFLEGKNMHHCLYNCYFDKIKNKEYIAFHMYSPEDCTFSFRRYPGGIKLDQIYLKYDRSVREETKNIAIKFMDDYNEQLDKLLKKSYKSTNLPYDFNDIFDDIPF